uniref:Uncharacterized protein n=1 Tax=Anguilla anguilla TaxID=7936 RepID=A0A0E9X5E4_ANGAN
MPAFYWLGHKIFYSIYSGQVVSNIKTHHQSTLHFYTVHAVKKIDQTCTIANNLFHHYPLWFSTEKGIRCTKLFHCRPTPHHILPHLVYSLQMVTRTRLCPTVPH